MTDLDPGVQGLVELGRNAIDRVTELEALTEKLSDLLKRSIIAIRGPEPELTAWGYHDLPDRCQQLTADLAHARADIERLSVDLAEAQREVERLRNELALPAPTST